MAKRRTRKRKVSNSNKKMMTRAKLLS